MGNNRYKILLIEDDKSICSVLETMLTAGGYQVLTAVSCNQGIMVFNSHRPDLVILDLGLPDRDGTAFIEQIRRDSTVPIIVLSARTQEQDKVSALDLGANDYITKPFGTAELMARLRAALRSGRYAVDAPEGIFALKNLMIDYDRRLVTVAGEQIHLTQTEYNILALLAHHPGRVLTYSTMIREIWGTLDDGSVKKLQVNMANIRKKLGTIPGQGDYILNELGVGYRMQEA